MLRCATALVVLICLFAITPQCFGQLPIRHASIGTGVDDLLGTAVAGAGDVNNDGVLDYIVGINGLDTLGLNAGGAIVYSGDDNSILYTFLGQDAGDQFGISVDGAGDVNNDGFDDVIVGSYLDDDGGINAGSVTVFSGLNGSIIYKIDGASGGDNLGVSVSGLGDLNGDGHHEFVVGAWLADAPSSDSGAARVFSGIDGSPIHTLLGDSTGDQFGCDVANAGDVNNDGINDIIVGSFLNDSGGPNAGLARIYSGADGSIIRTHNGNGTADLFGVSVDGAGDVNGDGHADVIVGAMLDDNNGSDSGSATVYSGFDGAVLHTFNGDSPGDRLGFAVAGSGDVNGDDIPDLVCGAPSTGTAGSAAGYAQLLNGSDGSLIRQFDGLLSGDGFGFSVSHVGDMNGDKFNEVVIGAPFQDFGGFNSGTAVVVSVGGARTYTSASSNPFLNLSLEWVPANGFSPYIGTVHASGAVPGGLGLAALSLAPDDTLVFGGFPMLLATDPGNLQGTLTFGFNAVGEISTVVSLQSPFTAGIVFFVQYFQTMPVPAATNGLELMIVK